jgi:hypothetical protein
MINKTVWGLAGFGGLLGGFLLHFWIPSGGSSRSICLFRRALDLPCPGCGLTRAFGALAKGDFAASWHLHPFALVLAVELFVAWLVVGWWLWRGRSLPASRRVMPYVLVQVAIYLALWTGRVATGTLPW